MAEAKAPNRLILMGIPGGNSFTQKDAKELQSVIGFAQQLGVATIYIGRIGNPSQSASEKAEMIKLQQAAVTAAGARFIDASPYIASKNDKFVARAHAEALKKAEIPF